jgi:hypothetical protein
MDLDTKQGKIRVGFVYTRNENPRPLPAGLFQAQFLVLVPKPSLLDTKGGSKKKPEKPELRSPEDSTTKIEDRSEKSSKSMKTNKRPTADDEIKISDPKPSKIDKTDKSEKSTLKVKPATDDKTDKSDKSSKSSKSGPSATPTPPTPSVDAVVDPQPTPTPTPTKMANKNKTPIDETPPARPSDPPSNMNLRSGRSPIPDQKQS